jgi:hypothetical protein
MMSATVQNAAFFHVLDLGFIGETESHLELVIEAVRNELFTVSSKEFSKLVLGKVRSGRRPERVICRLYLCVILGVCASVI